jgi:hypothetical protein
VERKMWERTGEYLIAEKSVEYVDDNLFMEIMDEKPQPPHARAIVVEAMYTWDSPEALTD